MRVGFDARPVSDPRGIGRYARSLLEALHETIPPGAELVETHRTRGLDVFHSPWIDGAALRSPCPMVVTLPDLVPLKRPGEYLRTGVHFRLRYMAVRRAARVVSYGWGVIPVEATIGGVKFTTSLFPKDDTYLLPIKLDVRRRTSVTVGDTIDVKMSLKPR